MGEFKFKPTIYIWLFLFNGRFIIVLWRKRLILDPDSCFLGNHRFQKVIRRSMILLQAIYAGLLLIYEFNISLFWAYSLGLMTIKKAQNTFFSINLPSSATYFQAWQGRKRQARGHHLHPSIQREWLIVDDQKNNILASLCLVSYLAANWLQKLETKHRLLRRSYCCSCVCVCVCVVSQFDISITKRNCLFVRCQCCPIYLALLCDVQISHYGRWTWWLA